MSYLGLPLIVKHETLNPKHELFRISYWGFHAYIRVGLLRAPYSVGTDPSRR